MKRNIIILISLVIILGVITTVFGLKNKNTNQDTVATGTHLINTSNNQGVADIIIPNTATTTTNKSYYIIGTYKKIERDYGMILSDEPPKKYTCDSFIITSGNDEFISKYKGLIAQGSTVHQLDANGNIIMNLDFQNTSQLNINKITSSEGEIKLTIMERDYMEGETEPCQSFMDIKEVSK